MKIKQAIQILKDHNEWRRFNSIDLPKTSDPKMAHPRELGIAIDTVVQHFETQNIVNNCYCMNSGNLKTKYYDND